LYPLTPKGDCHGHEEKSQKETSQEEEVVFAVKNCRINGQEEIRRFEDGKEEALKKMAW